MSVMVGVSRSNGWQIVEDDSYTDAVLSCGGFEFVDFALAPIDEALNRNPLGFQQLPNGSDIRFAKTKLRLADGDVIPAMTLFFHANKSTKTVTKLHVKYSSPESMAMAGNPWNDDEPPF